MALEALGEELSRDEVEYKSPAWHQEELAATERRVKKGQERLVDWETAKIQVRKQPPLPRFSLPDSTF